jgi:fatty-acyl-CoA synthase
MATSRRPTSGVGAAGAGLLRFAPTQNYTLADRFEERALEAPERSFLIWEGARISYGEANAQANRCAACLRSLGIEKGDTVALMLENSPQFFYLWIALSKLGCIAALINTQARGDALVHALEVSKSGSLLIGAECLDKLATARAGRIALPTFVVPGSEPELRAPSGAHVLPYVLTGFSAENPDPTLRAGTSGESILSLIFTSGTTGLPKACRLSNMRWMGAGDSVSKVLGLSRDEVFYCVLPLFHSAGGGSLFSTALATGGSIVLRRKFSASQFWEDVREFDVTFVQYIGELCRYLLNRPLDPLDGRHGVRHMVGSGLNPSTFARFQERFRVDRIIESYGGTDLNIGLVNLDNKPGVCGRIPPGEESPARLVKYDADNERYVRDAAGFLIECEVGEPGELLAKILDIPGVPTGRFEGYMDEEATENKIVRDAFELGDAYLSTGDLLKRDEAGYCYFVDRMGDTFRWKGENVSTAEVSTALSGHPDMELLTLYGVRVPQHEGRAGMAAIAMQEGRTFDPDAFFALAESQLPPYAVPLFIRIVERADITETFKLRTVDLKRRGYAPDRSGEALYVLDLDARRYCPLNAMNLARLGIPPFAQESE